MDDERLRRLFVDRQSLREDGTPTFGAVLHRHSPRRRLRPLALATATAIAVIAAVTLWPRDHAPHLSAAELMAWQAPTDALLDFDLGTAPVLEKDEDSR